MKILSAVTRGLVLFMLLQHNLCGFPAMPDSIQPAKFAGFRASRILQSYPNNQFPSANYWSQTAAALSGKFPGYSPAGIWIVSLYLSGGYTQLNFPSPGGTFPFTYFLGTDQNESYLTKFDQTGVKVWLQVEPGKADIDTLISIVLNRYKHHPCVAGFGIDVEWYNPTSNPGGKKVTDAEAQRWEGRVLAVDSNYTLFLKHYGQSWMPPAHRGKIIFVDDSQEFPNGLPQMVNEFISWGSKFSPNKTAFQIGYEIDSVWWRQYPDPAKTIGQALINAIPNCAGILWVDFTINKVFPIVGIEAEESSAGAYRLLQNYPNPFNPSTTISFELPERSEVELTVYNMMGEKMATLASTTYDAGTHSVEWNAAGLPSGIYFYELKAGVFRSVRKLSLIK